MINLDQKAPHYCEDCALRFNGCCVLVCSPQDCDVCSEEIAEVLGEGDCCGDVDSGFVCECKLCNSGR